MSFVLEGGTCHWCCGCRTERVDLCHFQNAVKNFRKINETCRGHMAGNPRDVNRLSLIHSQDPIEVNSDWGKASLFRYFINNESQTYSPPPPLTTTRLRNQTKKYENAQTKQHKWTSWWDSSLVDIVASNTSSYDCIRIIQTSPWIMWSILSGHKLLHY